MTADKKVQLREIITEISLTGQDMSLNQQQEYESRIMKLFAAEKDDIYGEGFKDGWDTALDTIESE